MNKTQIILIKEQLINYLTMNNLLDDINEYCEEMGFNELYELLNE